MYSGDHSYEIDVIPGQRLQVMIVMLEDFQQGVIEKSDTCLVRSYGNPSLLQSAGHDFAYKSLATCSMSLLL